MLFRSKKQVASLVITTMLLTTSLPIAAFADDASTTNPLNTAVVAEASENIIYVNPDPQSDDGQQNIYKTLQAAINAANEGDTIQLNLIYVRKVGFGVRQVDDLNLGAVTPTEPLNDLAPDTNQERLQHLQTLLEQLIKKES